MKKMNNQIMSIVSVVITILFAVLFTVYAQEKDSFADITVESNCNVVSMADNLSKEEYQNDSNITEVLYNASSFEEAEINYLEVDMYYFEVISISDNLRLDDFTKKFKDEYLIEMETEEEIEMETEPEIVKNYHLSIDSDVRIPSNLSVEEYEKMLEGTELAGIGEAIARAEAEHGVNGLYLLGLACLESGYGTTIYARERNNIVGWGAYDSNPDNAMYFESKSECILHVASRLKVNYLSEDGKYFAGYTPAAIDVHYCTDSEHANKIVKIVARSIEKLNK